MQERKTLSVLVAGLLTIAAIAAPTAIAMPADPVTQQTSKQDLRGEASADQSGTAVNSQTQTPAAQLDMHASTVQPPALNADFRTEAAADPSRAPEAPVGLPTWPVDPQPISPVGQQPVADGDGGVVDWPVPVLAIIGSLLLLGGLAVAGTRYRTTHAAG